MKTARMQHSRFAQSDGGVPLGFSLVSSPKETRSPKSKDSSGERQTENKLFQEDNPFSVSRLVGVNLQEEAAQGTALLPRLLLTPQARPVRSLPPVSMDQKGK